MQLHFDNSGKYSDVVLSVALKRRYGYAVLNIYLPSLVLLVVSYVTLFFRTSIFDVRMMAALTVQLVLCTLFSQISATLPMTSYFKMVDVWLMFCIGITFLVILFHAITDHVVNREDARGGGSFIKVVPKVKPEVKGHGLKAEERSVERKLLLGSQLSAEFTVVIHLYLMVDAPLLQHAKDYMI
ncbi:glutamate-gated chloride channel alpha-like [Penaeus vannamei]|uniref:glutamate-gated chloride channel alpha-like n=1 Tax=Penaeus vannamei TaxID=6689 RepID=UPI00387FA369